MKTLSLFAGAILFFALGAFGQDRGAAAQSAPPTERSPQAPYQAQPAPTAPAPEASNSKTFVGTVESLTEGKSMKIRTTGGKTKTFALRDAAVDPGVKVGSAVRVTQSRDVNGKGSLTVEPDQGEKK